MVKKTSVIAALGLALALTGLSGCGRKGDLEKPSVSAAEANVKRKPGEKPKPNPTPDRPFLLDPLL
ncbi:hypothetical protein BJF92_06055 [Rhizobium rhizosphaerae]|uniref:Lipoprotein n=1 Tax=Xaviernesmea rhizosphaerae TaxID=1672749 RepID=A0A1Q9AFN8_9HYPH|nr:lipoprotein [Xaviernesmea rhizosphaerae]OLP53777.1 hypothetical protein BJF92_06055 [Xaviernesmea rhizosphaerae]OQP85296.1 hypothetical protein BTR14_16430 [Xaviernesmea rhizosphaerae]